jgi:curli biogenesis system outer membrane secretion channel CsgG
MMKNKILLILFIAFLAGCGKQNLFESPENVKKHSTTGLVAVNGTLYTEGLKCVGKLIDESGQSGQITASVGQIQDKTAKELDTSISITQAAPDMALTALGTVGAVDLVGITDVTGLAQVDTTKCDVNQVGALGSISCLGSQFFLTGAISEFNKDIRNRSWGFTFFRKLLDTGVSSEDSVINVAMDLRLVASSGKILRNSKKELLMVSY